MVEARCAKTGATLREILTFVRMTSCGRVRRVNKGGYVYILTNRPGGTLYIGVTANLERRLSEHRLGVASKFTHKYNLHRLVHYEAFDEITYAIEREKQLKGGGGAGRLS